MGSNPKDYILFSKTFRVSAPPVKDFTGDRTDRADQSALLFLPKNAEGVKLALDSIIPTLDFPSDHAVISVELTFNSAQEPDAAQEESFSTVLDAGQDESQSTAP